MLENKPAATIKATNAQAGIAFAPHRRALCGRAGTHLLLTRTRTGPSEAICSAIASSMACFSARTICITEARRHQAGGIFRSPGGAAWGAADAAAVNACQRISAFLWRHAKPVERNCARRHADHDREFWLGNQIDAAAGVAEHFFDLKQIRFRVRREHGRDSLGDLGGIARSLGDEKGVSLVESNRQ